jgi:hypothetical protein
VSCNWRRENLFLVLTRGAGAIVGAQFIEEKLKLRSQNWLPHVVLSGLRNRVI